MQNGTSQLSVKEENMFSEISQIMDKYPAAIQRKYGLWRVHHHFDMAPNELLHETSSHETKESTLKVIKKEDLPSGAFATTWSLSDKGKPQPVSWCCDYSHPATAG